MEPQISLASIVVTRPQPAAQKWQTALDQRLPNAQVHSLPLIDIASTDNALAIEKIHRLWKVPQQFHAVAFVSRFAVVHFFAHINMTGAQFNQTEIRAWAVGQGTRDALIEAGISANHIDSPPTHALQFDSDTLWQQVAPQLQTPQTQTKSVLLVRGVDAQAAQYNTHTKNRLEHLLHNHHIAHTSVFVYARKIPVWSAQEQAFAMELLQKNSVWLFSSSMAIVHLKHLLPNITPAQWRMQQAVTTHVRIAQTAANCGFDNIQPCRPILDDVVQSILCLCKKQLIHQTLK